MEHQLLQNKNALIFGAKGSLGNKVAKAFKESGANVYLSDINVDGIEYSDLGEIRWVDTLNEAEVKQYFSWFEREGVSVDIVINLSASDPAEYNHGKPAVDVTLEQFLIPLKTTTANQFVTARAAFPLMAKQKSGVIIFITSTLAKVGSPWSTALSASHAATEGLVKSLATEWGAEGIRVIGVRSEAMPDSPTIDYTFTTMGANMGLSRDEMQGFIEQQKTALKRLPSTQETAGAIVLAASDLAGYMTGTMLNHSGGHILE
ncbi:SDR family NAD(P)-dependent oxidoreductase [Flagellimonas nanhaiensis]|uniref:SDR family NAD(P)-dependent oxidoreductase n=1 Tax=Flagellimonas nanhaiensis TaxID=2292706 RepID=A0A371JSU3_9FLAO|nr:SDR family oxidoreductase [Allomuricauda nanhaiensis]RDY60881.1 SDR family NAD(P)-dependent oxidoreductase [Allomuricauda nanhaiensis]